MNPTGALRHLTSIRDLDRSTIRLLIDRAAGKGLDGRRRCSVGLMFLGPSLRTRLSFAAATARLGGTPIDVNDLRSGPEMSSAESLDDTIRTASGMVDVLVVRAPADLAVVAASGSSSAPIVNAGDMAEHPTQALLDLMAIEAERGPVAELAIVVVGDLRMRTVRSLLLLLEVFPPRSLRLVAPPGRDAVELGPGLARITARTTHLEVAEADVVYMAGLPAGDPAREAGPLDAAKRSLYALGEQHLSQLRPDAVILSPLPVIDEIDVAVRADARLRMFQQSDRGVVLRMVVLEWLLDAGDAARQAP